MSKKITYTVYLTNPIPKGECLILFDLLFILIVILTIFLSSKRGLVKMSLNFFSFVASILITKLLYPVINSMFIKNENVVGFFSNIVGNSIDFNNILGSNADISSSILQGNYIKIAETLPKELQDLIGEINSLGMAEIFAETNTLKDILINYIAVLLINIFALILVFAVTSYVIKLISSYISIATSNVSLGLLDSVGGGVVGFIQIVVYIWIGIYFVRTFLPKEALLAVYNVVEGSFIMSILYKIASA